MIKRPEANEEVIAYFREIFAAHGGSLYGGEAVTQMEHGLQAALLAERDGASAELLVAALLHDVGHLLHDLPNHAPEDGVDDVHERLGAEWLGDRFPESVVEPIRMHVDAKRYLCAVDPGYRGTLSAPSETSLHLQGGPMSVEECVAFRQTPYFSDAVKLRHWDDQAKVVGLQTPPLEHFLRHVRDVLCTTNA